jgi:hypothetical protein
MASSHIRYGLRSAAALGKMVKTLFENEAEHRLEIYAFHRC